MTASALAQTVFAAPTLRNPRTLLFFVGALLFLALPLLASVNDDRWDIGTQRRVYWSGTFGAALCAFLAGLPDWLGGVQFAAGVVLLLTANAYLLTSYLKVGGRVVALHPRDAADADAGASDDRPPADAYGGSLTAPKMWWMLVVGMVICAANVVGRYGASLLWIAFAIPVLLLAIGFGYMDAAARQRFARGQLVQFAIIAVVTAGVFAALYAIGFGLSGGWNRRRPV